MGHNLGLGIPVIDLGLEDLDFLLGDLSPPQPADQFIGFAAEHGTGNNFQGARVPVHG
jgi:hypothetical protein